MTDDSLPAAEAVKAADPLLEPCRGQRQIQMDDRIGEAQIESFFARTVRHEYSAFT